MQYRIFILLAICIVHVFAGTKNKQGKAEITGLFYIKDLIEFLDPSAILLPDDTTHRYPYGADEDPNDDKKWDVDTILDGAAGYNDIFYEVEHILKTGQTNILTADENTLTGIQMSLEDARDQFARSAAIRGSYNGGKLNGGHLHMYQTIKSIENSLTAYNTIICAKLSSN